MSIPHRQILDPFLLFFLRHHRKNVRKYLDKIVGFESVVIEFRLMFLMEWDSIQRMTTLSKNSLHLTGVVR